MLTVMGLFGVGCLHAVVEGFVHLTPNELGGVGVAVFTPLGLVLVLLFADLLLGIVRWFWPAARAG
jgi:hypothetical protein